ncbi:hypothetical protein CRYUN_Cryun28dG0032900 [Craigia yunnanensis]
MGCWGRRSSVIAHHIRALSKVDFCGSSWSYPNFQSDSSTSIPLSLIGRIRPVIGRLHSFRAIAIRFPRIFWVSAHDYLNQSFVGPINGIEFFVKISKFDNPPPYTIVCTVNIVEKQCGSQGNMRGQLSYKLSSHHLSFASKKKLKKDQKRIPCNRVLDDDGELIRDSDFEQVNKELGVKMYSDMVTLQMMETLFYEAQRQGRISFYGTSFGEEAINIASAAALGKDDIVLPQHREPGVLSWRGFTLQEFANQCFENKADGGKGRQMPIHYGSSKHNFVTVSSPIATRLPQAAGMVYSLKMDKKDVCAVAFIGDSGTIMEAPVIFVCRNNGWAISTPISEQFRSKFSLMLRAKLMESQASVDGTDALAVYSAIHAARNMAISEQGAVLVETLAYRVGDHSTSDDSTKYRPLDKIEYWKMNRSPVNKFRKWVEINSCWSERDEAELRNSIKKQLFQAIQVAEKTEKPPLTEFFADVYDLPPSNLLEQEKQLEKLSINIHKISPLMFL